DTQAPRRVDDQDVVIVAAREVERRHCDGNRLLAARGREEIDAELSGQRLELLDRGRTVYVGTDDEHLLPALLLEHPGEFAGGSGLAGALQAGQQNDRRRG